MSRILVTGGAGFLGSHLAHRFLADGHHVIILDIAPLEDVDLIGRVEFYQGDVRNALLVGRLAANVDAIVHCAAALPLWPEREIYSTNIGGTRTVMQAALDAGVRAVHISSTAVYGVPEKHPLYEDDPLVGVGAYGESKIAAEAAVEELRSRGLVATVLRPKTFIGVGRLGVFQILFEWVKDGKRIPIIGNGQNRYQLFAVEDLVQAIVQALAAPDDVANQTYNVGAKEFGTVNEDFDKLFAVAGTGSRLRKTPPRFVKFWLWVFEQLNLSPLYRWIYGTADKDSFVSIEKAERLLDWHPAKSNADALIETYQWYLQHWQEYAHRQGITHRVAWKQGVLKVVKWLS